VGFEERAQKIKPGIAGRKQSELGKNIVAVVVVLGFERPVVVVSLECHKGVRNVPSGGDSMPT
jgi:hypothetical protein